MTPRTTASALIPALAFFCASVSAGPIVDINFIDPSPPGPSNGTAGESLELGAPYTISGVTITALPASDEPLDGSGILANTTSMGVNSDFSGENAHQIESSLGESLTLSFDRQVRLISMDLSAVGTDVTSGATLAIGAFSIDLFTNVAGFNGNSDIYTFTQPFFVAAGTPIVLTGSGANSSFGIQGIVAELPEPATGAVLALSIWGVGAGRGRRGRAIG